MVRALALALTLVLALSACASGGGAWPSLAMRPGEVAPLVPRPAAVVATDTTLPAAARPAADLSARIAGIERDVTALAGRLTPQIAATRAAAAGVAVAGSEAEATAELEISRLDRLGGQAADLRDQLDALAGDLARGGGGTTELARIGAAIERVEALRAEQAAALAASR